MSFETVEVPFQTLGNHQVLTAQQTIEQPWLAEFISSFPACFEYDHLRAIWIFYPNGERG